MSKSTSEGVAEPEPRATPRPDDEPEPGLENLGGRYEDGEGFAAALEDVVAQRSPRRELTGAERRALIQNMRGKAGPGASTDEILRLTRDSV